MSPSSSKTIVRPSGERSSESHVPSSVVNLSAFVGVSGNRTATGGRVAATSSLCRDRPGEQGESQ